MSVCRLPHPRLVPARPSVTNHSLSGDSNTIDKKLGGTYIAECVEYSIQGSREPFLATQQAPPSPATQNVDLGILTCGSGHRPGDQQYFMTVEEVNSAVDEFCTHLHDNPVEFKSGGVPLQAIRTGPSDHQISVSATWKDAKGCPNLNFKDKSAVDICKKRLSNPINLCKYFRSLAPSRRLGCYTNQAHEKVTPQRTTTTTGSRGARSFAIALVGML